MKTPGSLLALRLAFIIAILPLVAIPADAQSDTLAPHAPYLARVPDNAHWTITLKYPTPASATPGSEAKPLIPPGAPVQIETVKYGTSRQVTLLFPDGKNKKFDFLNGYMMTMTNLGPSVSVVATFADPPYPFYTIDFLFTDWVRTAGLSAFKGTDVYNGITCFHYRNADGLEAWIDPKTSLPVAAKGPSHVEAAFQFQSPPDSPLVFPAAETDTIRNIETTAKVLQAVR